MKGMLHNEARELLVKGYEKSHDAAGIAQAYSVSIHTVYRLVKQKRETGSVALRTSQRGRKPVLTAADKEKIRQCIKENQTEQSMKSARNWGFPPVTQPLSVRLKEWVIL